MTLDEKAAQMMCVWQEKAAKLVDEQGNFSLDKAKASFRKGHGLGQVGRPSDAAIRTVAIRWRLIPQTMKGKQWLKRLFYGKLTALEGEVHERMAALEPLVELSPGSDTHSYKVLYAVAQRGRIASGKTAA